MLSQVKIPNCLKLLSFGDQISKTVYLHKMLTQYNDKTMYVKNIHGFVRVLVDFQKHTWFCQSIALMKKCKCHWRSLKKKLWLFGLIEIIFSLTGSFFSPKSIYYFHHKFQKNVEIHGFVVVWRKIQKVEKLCWYLHTTLMESMQSIVMKWY